MDTRIILEQLGHHPYYIVYELALGTSIGGVIRRRRHPETWCAVTPENAAHNVWKCPIEGTASTKEEAAEFLLPRLREPQLY